MKKVLSHQRKRDLNECITHFVVDFCKEISPAFTLLGLTDDESLNKFIRSTTLEEPYKEALERDPVRIKMFEEFSSAKGEDFWKAFRGTESKGKNPREKGFVFKEMPLAFEANRDSWIKAISFKNGLIEISEEVIREESYIAVSPETEKCYELVSDFCNKLKELNCNRNNARILFSTDREGNLVPNEEGIIWGNVGLH